MNCGRVAEARVMDMQGEWRNFADSDKDHARAQQVDEYLDDLTTSVQVPREDALLEIGDIHPITSIYFIFRNEFAFMFGLPDTALLSSVVMSLCEASAHQILFVLCPPYFAS